MKRAIMKTMGLLFAVVMVLIPLSAITAYAAEAYTVDLTSGKAVIATKEEFWNLWNSLGAYTRMESTSGSSTYFYDLDKDSNEDVLALISSSQQYVQSMSTISITDATYVISDSTAEPYNPITFLFNAEAPAPAIEYPVWVGPTQVTSANKDDILGDGGKAKYDPDSKTLTLDKPSISGTHEGAAVYADADLSIKGSATLSNIIWVKDKDLTLDADIDISTPGKDSAIVAGNITVNGGSINASADEVALSAGSSITINDGSVVGNECGLSAENITIAGGTVNVSSEVSGINSNNNITISGGEVTATGKEEGILCNNYSGQILISGGTIKAKGTTKDGISGICPISITGGTVETEGGSAGIYTNRTVTIGNGITRVTADGANNAIRGLDIQLGDALIIQEPAGGTIGYMSGGDIVLDGENAATHAVIVPGTTVTYDVTVHAVDEASDALAGVKLQLLKEGSILDEWTSNSSAHIISGLVAGDYTIHEVEAPEGYKTTADNPFSIMDADSTVIMVHAKTEVSILSVDESESPLAGAYLQILDPADLIMDEWSADTAAHVILGLKTETTYKIHEKTTPAGYTVPADQTFVIAADGTVTYSGKTNSSEAMLVKHEPIGCSVTFDANGHGTAPAVQTVNSGETATEPTAPTESGWTFGGWYTEAECTTKFDFSTTITSDITLYAKWTEESVTPPVPTTHTVTFESNGGSGSMSDMMVNEGEKLTLPDNGFTSPEGKEFDKWDAGAPGDKIDITADKTIKALWKDKESEPTPEPEPTPGPEPEPAPAPAAEYHHEHNYVWQVTRKATPTVDGEMVYACKECGAVAQRIPISGYAAFNEDAANKIKNAKQGAEVVISTQKWISFYSIVWNELAKRPDVKLVIDYQDKGKMYEVVIPAGTDVKTLMNNEGYAGFLFLSGKFGRHEIRVY